MSRIVFLLMALLALSSSLRANPQQSSTKTLSPDLPSFISRVESLRQMADIPGLSFAVVKDQEIILAMGLVCAELSRAKTHLAFRLVG